MNPPISITFSREDATILYVALNAAEHGFTPANAVAAADNLNLLHPGVSALDKGKNAFGRDTRRVNKDVAYKLLTAVEGDARLDKLADDLQAKQDETITLELLAIDLTPDEISAAKLRPGHLALFRRWLRTPDKKPSA